MVFLHLSNSSVPHSPSTQKEGPHLRNVRLYPEAQELCHREELANMSCRSNMIRGCTRLPSRTPLSLSVTDTNSAGKLSSASSPHSEWHWLYRERNKAGRDSKAAVEGCSVQRVALQVIWKWSRSICTQASSLTVEGSQSSNDRTRLWLEVK